jgi:hypothetical protein
VSKDSLKKAFMHETIAVIFDFDDTLAPDTTSGFLKHQGVEPQGFWLNEVNPMYAEDWDPVPAYLYKMIEAAGGGRLKLTKEALSRWGKVAPLHPGTDTIFKRLREVAEEANPNITLEFYVISSGIGDVLRDTSIASNFKDIWSSDFHYDEAGNAVFAKKIVRTKQDTCFTFKKD